MANLEDLIDPEYGLQQDEWSLTRPRFGAEGQLEVIGWSGKRSQNKQYILKCSVCGKDPELYGGGNFKMIKGNLNTGNLPCGCSSNPRLDEEQNKILCARRADLMGYSFKGFVGAYTNKRNTMCVMSCKYHGEWVSTSVSSLLVNKTRCPMCKAEVIGAVKTKPDDVMIASFLASGRFHPDTKFWRSDRKRKSGSRGYWYVSCPDCGQVGESMSNQLQDGCRPCACSGHRPQECYVNWLIDNNNMALAIKFGVAVNSESRAKRQDSKSIYVVRQHSIYFFPDVASCKKAERECKQTLECGVLTKEEMPDGFTESTWVYNLDKIISIYEKHGGKRIK